MLINEIKKVLPNSKIKYVKKNDDPRDYRVNCDKIKNELGFKISMTVPDGIIEIKHLIENIHISLSYLNITNNIYILLINMK